MRLEPLTSHTGILINVSSINYFRFAEFVSLIYPPELEVKETTDTASSASFLDLYLELDDSGQLNTNIYDKWDDFNFKIINFPNMCSNIPASPANGFRGDGLKKIGQSETRIACDRRVC
jgi:hypothetical protein